jgi:hypothetical protein
LFSPKTILNLRFSEGDSTDHSAFFVAHEITEANNVNIAIDLIRFFIIQVISFLSKNIKNKQLLNRNKTLLEPNTTSINFWGLNFKQTIFGKKVNLPKCFL